MHLNLVRSYETPSDPTRCPLSPRGYPHWCGWPFVLVRLVRLAALHLQPVRLAGFRAACCSLLLVRLVACGLARYLSLFARIACGSALLLCTLASLAPCCSDSLASCAALLVRCWFLSGLFQCFAVYWVSLHLSSLAALLGICFFRSHRSRLSLVLL